MCAEHASHEGKGSAKFWDAGAGSDVHRIPQFFFSWWLLAVGYRPPMIKKGGRNAYFLGGSASS